MTRQDFGAHATAATEILLALLGLLAAIAKDSEMKACRVAVLQYRQGPEDCCLHKFTRNKRSEKLRLASFVKHVVAPSDTTYATNMPPLLK